jgi:glycerol kinase
MALVVAIDAGTTGVRTMVVDETGSVVDLAYREISQHFPQPGWVEQDPVEIWSAVRATLVEIGDRLSARPGAVAAVGIANQRETVVAFDRRTGTPRHRAIVWQDRRTAGHCTELERDGWLPLVRARTGLVLDPYFSATKMAWLLRHAVDSERATPGLALGTVDSWILWNLTGGPDGGVFATDHSNASRTSLFDTEQMSWSDELCGVFGVSPDVLAEVRPSVGRFGLVRAGGAIPLPAALDEVPVSGMAGDQHAALFGQACFAPGTAKVTYGTGSFVLVNAGAARPSPPEGLLATVAWHLGAHGGPEGPVAYALEGAAFASGAAIQWLRDGIGILDRVRDIGPLAESVPDAGGVCFVPAFTGLGSPSWDPSARGAIIGLTQGSGRAVLARAVVEAIAYEVRSITDAMASSGRTVVELRADGGVAALDLLLRLQANQSRIPVTRPAHLESTALGAAALAGLAEGVWGSLTDIADLRRTDARFEPSGSSDLADADYQRWRAALERSKGWAAGRSLLE